MGWDGSLQSPEFSSQVDPGHSYPFRCRPKVDPVPDGAIVLANQGICGPKWSIYATVAHQVSTEMDQDDQSRWHGARLALGQALLTSSQEYLTASELAEATGKDASNVGKLAERMVADGLLRSREPRRIGGHRGRRPSKEYALMAGGRVRLDELLETRIPGALCRGQQLILAEVDQRTYGDLLLVLSDTSVLSQATWSALWHGDRQEYVIAFGDDDGLVGDMAAALDAAGIPFRRTTVVNVGSAQQLVAQARRASRTAERTRLRQRTRRAAAG